MFLHSCQISLNTKTILSIVDMKGLPFLMFIGFHLVQIWSGKHRLLAVPSVYLFDNHSMKAIKVGFVLSSMQSSTPFLPSCNIFSSLHIYVFVLLAHQTLISSHIRQNVYTAFAHSLYALLSTLLRAKKLWNRTVHHEGK